MTTPETIRPRLRPLSLGDGALLVIATATATALTMLLCDAKRARG